MAARTVSEDIVDRLRYCDVWSHTETDKLLDEAADEIERLREGLSIAAMCLDRCADDLNGHSDLLYQGLKPKL